MSQVCLSPNIKTKVHTPINTKIIQGICKCWCIISIYLEPVCPLFWGFNPPIFPVKTGVIWIPGIYISTICFSFPFLRFDYNARDSLDKQNSPHRCHWHSSKRSSCWRRRTRPAASPRTKAPLKTGSRPLGVGKFTARKRWWMLLLFVFSIGDFLGWIRVKKE